MNLGEVLAAAAAQQAGQEENGKNSSLTEAQQINRLRSWYEAQTTDLQLFDPGDILRHKRPGLANSMCAQGPVVFLEYLDEPVEIWKLPQAFEDVSDWFSTVTGHRLDCIVGVIARGDVFAPFLVDSRMYVKVEED